jgi:hypothetical protein
MRYYPRTIASECAGELAASGGARLEGDDVSISSIRCSRQGRGAATAMEYLFVISLILCAAMTGIGYFGQSTKGSMQKSSTAIQNATTK